MPGNRVIVQDGMRQGTQLYHNENGFSYHTNKLMKGGRVYLRCNQYFNKRCHGSGSLGQDGDFRRVQRHNHAPENYLIHERRLRHAVLNRCKLGDPSDFRDIYHEERRRLHTPREAAANVPFKSLRPSMQRARGEGWPHLPHTLSELGNLLQREENVNITCTLDGKDNIFAGVVGQSRNRTRCICLFSRRKLKYMRRVQTVFCDGTFVVPQDLGCSQILTLIAVRRHHIIVLGWVLMQSRLTEAYVTALEAIRNLQMRFRPFRVICDFEKPQQAAWHRVFPNAEIQGCYFHFTKAICEYVKKLGLIRLLKENEHADSIVRSLCAIPLLPSDLLVEGYDLVLERATRRGLDVLAPTFLYFLNTWLRPSMITKISVCECEDRTNNACESSNRTLRSEVKRRHPNIYHLLGVYLHG